jgi:hypothetical protein
MRTMEVERAYRPEARPLAMWPKHACCCTAMPVVKVVMPPTAHRPDSVELYLCGHHFRTSRAALAEVGATRTFRDRETVIWWS